MSLENWDILHDGAPRTTSEVTGRRSEEPRRHKMVKWWNGERPPRFMFPMDPLGWIVMASSHRHRAPALSTDHLVKQLFKGLYEVAYKNWVRIRSQFIKCQAYVINTNWILPYPAVIYYARFKCPNTSRFCCFCQECWRDTFFNFSHCKKSRYQRMRRSPRYSNYFFGSKQEEPAGVVWSARSKGETDAHSNTSHHVFVHVVVFHVVRHTLWWKVECVISFAELDHVSAEHFLVLISENVIVFRDCTYYSCGIDSYKKYIYS